MTGPMVPPDVLREQRMTLDEWASKFDRSQMSSDDQAELARAARTLHRNPTASLVIARLEAKTVRGLVNCPAVEHDKAEDFRFMLLGIRAFWKEIEAMSADADLRDKTSSKK